MRSTPRLKRLISTVTGMLRDREAVLIGDVETVRHQKEKELQLQKDELEFLLSGIRQAVIFSEAMVKESSDTEIVAGHHQVVSRMATLTREREKVQLEPVTKAKIEFVGMEEGMELLGSVIKELRTVDDGISAEQLIVEMSNYHHQINQAYSFKVILVDMKGNKVSSKMLRQSIKSLAVEMAGSSNVKVSTFQPEKEVISFPFISILDLIDHH